MQVGKSRGEFYNFSKNPPRLRRTFETPLNDLPRFVNAILSPFDLKAAQVTIETTIFDPERLTALLAKHSLTLDSYDKRTLLAENGAEVSALLEACLAEWLDFLFTPSPELFLLYGDHDEWTTLFSEDESALELVTNSVRTGGFQVVPETTKRLGRKF